VWKEAAWGGGYGDGQGEAATLSETGRAKGSQKVFDLNSKIY